jgi:outer membrane lipoprotein SlyB
MNLRLPILVATVVLLGACASTPSYRGPPPGAAPVYSGPSSPSPCHACGRVVRIDVISGDRRTDGSGAVIGGVVGGVLGNQVGKGDGRKAATVAGVVAGAVVGNEVQKNANGPTYDIRVQMDDGRRLIYNQRELGGIAVGSYVDVYDNRVHLVR